MTFVIFIAHLWFLPLLCLGDEIECRNLEVLVLHENKQDSLRYYSSERMERQEYM